MVSYQMFTQTAFLSVASALGSLWLRSSVDLAVFICGFAWMFVLSSVVSKLMFGRERRLSIQFLTSLALTLAGSAVLGLLRGAGLNLTDPNVLSSPFNAVFGNVYFAFFYLALPFIFMVAIDFRAVQRKRK